MRISALWLGVLAACSSNSGSTPTDAARTVDTTLTSTDAPATLDAPIAEDGGGAADAPSTHNDGGSGVPATITLSGFAFSEGTSGSAALAGVTVDFFKVTDETTPVATATTDGSGGFSVTINTGGQAVDGFARGHLTGYVDDYAYPPYALTSDFHGEIGMLTTGTYTLLETPGYGQGSANGLIVAQVVDASFAPITGATVSSTPAGMYRYTGSLGPNGTTSTGSDGLGYFFNATVGTVKVTAAKTGLAFGTTTVKARADTLTSTVIIEQ